MTTGFLSKVAYRMMAPVFIVLSVLVRQPIRHQPLWGDDSLLLRASRMPKGYASSFGASFLQTGSFKYRPLTTPILSLAVGRFGNDVYWYQYINCVLIGVLAAIAGYVALHLSSSLRFAYASGSVVVVTRFNWYSQDNVFGLMELSALILLMLSVAALLRSLRSQGRRTMWISMVSLLSATLVHERYVLASVAIPVALVASNFVIRDESLTRMARRPLSFLAIPLIHIVLKSGLLNVSPLTGGGESNFSAVKGPWILKHFVASLTSVFGWSAGYKEASLRGNVPHFIPPVLGVVGLAGFCVLVAVGFQRTWRSEPESLATGAVLLAIGSAVTLSASVVIERIEFRWLYAPLLLALMVIVWAYRMASRQSRGLVYVILGTVLLSEMLFQPYHRDVALSSRRIDSAVKAVSRDGSQGPWKLVVLPRNWDGSWQWWSFAYGNVFMELNNAPQSVLLVGDMKSASRACRTDWNQTYCTLLLVDGKSESVERIDFRPAKYPN